MEESFQLMSSMSPKVKGRQKHFRKGATLLALKKHIRRSSIYDKLAHTVNNEELIITDGSTTESWETGKSKVKVLNKYPIVISDSDCSDTDSRSQLTSTSREKSPPKRNSLLSKDKLNDINLWIENVNVENKIKEDTTVYSELSTIYGDEYGADFVPEAAGHAANSTFAESAQKRFDELFARIIQNNLKDEEQNMNDNVTRELVNNKEIKDCNDPVIDLVIDDSVIGSDGSLDAGPEQCGNSSDTCNMSSKVLCKARLHKNSKSIDVAEKLSENSMLLKNSAEKSQKYSKSSSYSPKKKQNERLSFAQKNQGPLVDEREVMTMLDDLYGDKWRENEEHVLAKTEPRKGTAKRKEVIPNSERKPKSSLLYKNPSIDTEKSKSRNLLQDLQRFRMTLKSSCMQRINDLCDSDTDSEKNGGPRMKLDFGNDSEHEKDENINRNDKKSKYFTNAETGVEQNLNTNEWDKENDDFSHLGKSLEDRIRKKMNKIEDVPKRNKVKSNKNQTPKKTERKTLKEISNKGNNPSTKNIPNSTGSSNSSVENKIHRKPKSETSNSSVSSDDTWEKEIKKTREIKPIKGKYSFLASLSANVPILRCDMSARIYRNSFKIYKDQLLKKLFKLYNESIFENALPEDTLLEWNDKMRGTAGYCYCKKITRKTGTVERSVRIVLSTKVIDAAYRLRDTLIHEMCHAATWIVNCVSDGHGPYWKSWAFKAMKTFPELPPIKRCHDYVINTKYTYKCTGCGYSIGRHSKSIDIERKRCGYCLGKFEVLINKTTKKGEIKSVPATPKKEATGFALFVKQNYGIYKKSELKHGDVMKLLGKKFQEMKVNPS